MPKVARNYVISAPIEAVWSILVDPEYVPKLYPDVMKIVVEPEGEVKVGQRRSVFTKVGKRIVEIRTEVAEVTPKKKMVIKNREGGAFGEFHQVIELKSGGGGTEVHAEFLATASKEYFGPTYNAIALERLAMDNGDRFLKNLKELAELQPLR